MTGLRKTFDAIGSAKQRYQVEVNSLRLEFGKLIKLEREARKLSLRQLGLSLGVSSAFLSDVEKGRRMFSDATMRSLIKKWDL